VPTVGGETNFHPAMTATSSSTPLRVGLADTDKIFYSAASGVGNAGRLSRLQDRPRRHPRRHHGVAEFDEEIEEKRPTVQVGDPFTEKLLLEACLELMATDASSPSRTWARRPHLSSVEMGAKGGLGIELDLDKVPSAKPA
jgi:phosphoribosylformylglycinamidine (FGAM) synthase-like enzyme